MADLDEIMSGRGSDSATETPTTPVETVQPEPPAEQQPGQPRDEHGKFATKQPEEPEAPQPPPEQPRAPDGYVPIQALDARLAKQQERHEAMLRQQAEQFQQQLRAVLPPQPAPTPPDMFENPALFVQHHTQPLHKALETQREQFSQLMAVEKFGQEAVQAAYAELERRVQQNSSAAQADYYRIMRSPHPYGELVTWHKQNSALSKYGDDPEAYINAEIERRMAARAPQPQTQPTLDPRQLPSSFAGTANRGPAGTPQWTGPKPLSEIMPR